MCCRKTTTVTAEAARASDGPTLEGLRGRRRSGGVRSLLVTPKHSACAHLSARAPFPSFLATGPFPKSRCRPHPSSSLATGPTHSPWQPASPIPPSPPPPQDPHFFFFACSSLSNSAAPPPRRQAFPRSPWQQVPPSLVWEEGVPQRERTSPSRVWSPPPRLKTGSPAPDSDGRRHLYRKYARPRSEVAPTPGCSPVPVPAPS